MKLELHIPRKRYLLGENVSVDLRLTNTGSAAIQAPELFNTLNSQPVYRLTGPSIDQSVAFTYRDMKLSVAEREVAPAMSKTATIEPGEYLETDLVLNQLKPLTHPGSYTLSARIDWNGWSAEAQPVTFEMEASDFQHASLGVDLFSSSTRTLRVVWISRAGSGNILGESFFYEKRPDLGEIQVTGTRIIYTAGPQAAEPFCPWTNYDRADGAGSWHGWREGSRLFAIAMGGEKPQSFNLPSDQAKVIRPALMLRNGDLQVFYLSADRRTLGMIRFYTPGKAGAKPPEEVWRLPLPDAVISARVALGPESAGSRRAVALLSQHEGRIAVRLARLQEARAELSDPLMIADAHAAPDCELAATFAADGAFHVAGVFTKDAGRRQAAMFEARFALVPGGENGVKVTMLGALENPLAASAVAYSAAEAADVAPYAVLQLADGSWRYNLRPFRVPAASVMPLELLRSGGATYVLLLRAQAGPELFGIQ